METRLPDSEVKIRMSICPKCNGFMAAAVVHQMDDKMKQQMAREAAKYDLDIVTIPLLQYRSDKRQYCTCPRK